MNARSAPTHCAGWPPSPRPPRSSRQRIRKSGRKTDLYCNCPTTSSAIESDEVRPGARKPSWQDSNYDHNGVRRGFDDIPSSVSDLRDDPFRSLAGELRRAGGFSKETTPFSEFLWADFLRRRIERKAVVKDFAKAMEKALALAKSQEAHYLPGWCGPATNMA